MPVTDGVSEALGVPVGDGVKVTLEVIVWLNVCDWLALSVRLCV